MDKIKVIINGSWKYAFILLLMGLLYTDVAFAGDNEFAKAWNGLMGEYKNIVAGVAGLGAMSSLLIFIIHMFQLATLGSAHSTERRKILNNILISGACTALLGGIGMIYILLYTSVFF